MTTAIEKTKQQIFSWQKQLDAVACNQGYDSLRFMAGAAMAFQNDERLIQCLETPEGQQSALQELKCAASLGINLNPAEQLGCLVARKDNKTGKLKIHFQIMKNGLMMLAKESKEIDAPVVDLVREKDFFDIVKSDDGDQYTHKPVLKNRGEIIGFYAAMRFKATGKSVIKYMSIDEMEEHKVKYSSAYLTDENGNVKDNASWNKSFPGMGMKTVLKYLLRSFAISRSLTIAITHDDKFEAGEEIETEIINVTPKGVSADDALKQLNAKEKKEPKKNEKKKEETKVKEKIKPDLDADHDADIESEDEGDIL